MANVCVMESVAADSKHQLLVLRVVVVVAEMPRGFEINVPTCGLCAVCV